MSLISPSQLRAARGLLNCSQTDLAKLSGISKPTLHRFENGLKQPVAGTMNKLLKVFDRFGIEFLEYQGVRYRPRNIFEFDGVERFNEFYDFLYDHLKKFGGDVCVSVYDETLLERLRKDKDLHKRRMKKLKDMGKLKSFRIFTAISEFDTTDGYSEFRCLPLDPVIPTGFYAFGDCLALMSFVDRETPHIVVMHTAALAEGYKQGFNMAWELGPKPAGSPLSAPFK
jgi:transcriptional regulator with XRE-family HTH domain